MPSRLTLTINDVPGVTNEVAVPLGRFSIGRSADNDLVIDLPGLSRRHALISNFEGEVQISDCGSQNGTFVNGLQVEATVGLKDGDVISLGQVCEISVHLHRNDEATKQSSAIQFPPLIDKSDRISPAPVQKGSKRFINAPIIALASAGVIVLTAIITIMIMKMIDGDKREDWKRDPDQNGGMTPTPTLTPSPTRPCEGLTLRQIELAAQQVITRISNDAYVYAFPPDQSHLTRIKETVERYCGSSSLAIAMRDLKQSRGSLKELSENQISPDLLAYAVLAETNGGTSDMTGTARKIAPKLIAVWKLFGDTHADSALILLAAYKIGEPGRGTHPILNRMSTARIDLDSDRNVWELYRRKGLTEDEYDFVIRFLAFGIMFQQPRMYGLDVPT